jgi:leader peptidase (prepilin peptidase)/N-methyltransferase
MMVLMETAIIYIALVLVGLCLGSFAGASVWRLRARQLKADKKAGERVNLAEYKKLLPLTKETLTHDRSRCLHCSYELKWYDLVPLVSWIALKGRCRQCRKPIGYFEPIIELSVAVFFVLSYLLWPYALVTPIDISRLIIWLISGVGLAILFAYDLKWFLLPDRVVFILIGLGIINSVVVVLQNGHVWANIFSILGAIVILSGIYYGLYLLSKGRWIGFGDIKLGLALALLLGDWELAFIALFAANLIGCLIVIPAMALGKLKRQSHVPFGPLLIGGFVVAQLVGSLILSFYFNTLL